MEDRSQGLQSPQDLMQNFGELVSIGEGAGLDHLIHSNPQAVIVFLFSVAGVKYYEQGML